ncbi:MAG: calcium:proton antiporter [Rubinisphaera brasiliensis]|uniref:Sodium/calcium exchanger membrane region n=1 Tax=Rubinisphaera brasiliensis (strain ATCC 49424 / DSM 5305 / JCM 21570 / IAM 15109 / NBRC 103401 / IFAM 1448) TaxID=756272 RepID=F0SJY6_RUBBR|nr:ionic transporter y4hA [Rubinisphaera brasiliensis]ADY58675.1 sodium/calcium exchanger membrane region [Rubinisphaera brasiliensis DSM 5305]MBB03763.1 ionic transporter y4hA [Planctomyces sp.]
MSALKRILGSMPTWSIVIPPAACLVLVLAELHLLGALLLPLSAVALLATVLVAVHHAETIAHRIGEPYGALVLALAVTLIEVSLLISMMLSDHVDSSGVVRDAVFATVMIVCNGVIGLCLLVGALKHRVLGFRTEGTTPALSVLATLATMSLVLPDFTFTTEGPTFSTSQLLFAAVVSLALYGVFVFVQTVWHRDYFLPLVEEDEVTLHEEKPSLGVTIVSFLLLVLSLASVVGLAESLAPVIEGAIQSAGLPHSVVGIAIATMVLLPETMAAVKAALRNHMQISFNLALGSALATISLTIPAVAFLSIGLGLSMDLGLPPKEIALLALTLLLATMTLSSGRATIMQGAVHLVVFAVFLFMSLVP